MFRLFAYLSLPVESDYTVVFIAARGGHAPSWHWVWTVYPQSQVPQKPTSGEFFVEFLVAFPQSVQEYIVLSFFSKIVRLFSLHNMTCIRLPDWCHLKFAFRL